MKLINNDGELERFEPKRIKNKIISETGLNEQEAEKIKNAVVNQIRKQFQKEVTTSTIRSLINAQLIKRGLLKEEIKSRKLGMSVRDFETLLNQGDKSNANLGYSPEMVSWYSFESISKEYALLNMPEDCAEAHTSCHYHIHDLSSYYMRPNCFTMSLNWVARNGVKIDGVGENGSVAGPAKSLEVLLNHALQVWMALATVLSGGVGYNNFNTYLAPFAKDRSYKDIKQAIQSFIFNCNMSLVCRGGQTLFSSIGVDLSIPDVLKDADAYGPGGIVIGKYGDYQEEADLIFRAICEVIEEKDYVNRPHRYPNCLFNIREGDLDEYKGNCKILHEMAVNNPQIYFNNCKDLERSTMGALSFDTPVLSKEGWKYPYELRFGDRVMTYNEDGCYEWKPIYNVIKKQAPKKVFHITCDNGCELKVSTNHKFPTTEGIVKSEDLIEGMHLFAYVEKESNIQVTTSIRSIEWVDNEDPVYDLSIVDNENYVCGLGEGIHSQNCRSSLPMNYSEDYFKDCTNTGNFQYVTLNLPLFALEAEGDIVKFYKILEHYCELARKSLLHRREVIKDVLFKKNMSTFLTQKDVLTGEPLYDIDRTTITLGYCGLNEALLILYGKDVVEAAQEGTEIIQFLNQKKDEYYQIDGLRWSVIASPAESTAHRFAEHIKEKYPDAPVQGKPGNYYLTNSSHISVKDNSMFIEHIRNADRFHRLSLGGNILHLWMGEVWSDPEAYWSLNKKILETNTIFWAYSKCYTFCNECRFTINDKLEKCPICGSTDLQVWDRITGYYVPCSNYNNGKLQEFEDRFRHKKIE